jgi:uncharacterized protein YkwD
MRLRIFSCLLLLAVAFNAAARNLYTEINRQRAGDGNCAVARNLPPLRPQSALERVARDLARGDQLEQSLQAAGYRAAHSSTLSSSGDGIGAQAESILAGQNACRLLRDGAMTEVGIYIDARQFWIVMAAPLVSYASPTSRTSPTLLTPPTPFSAPARRAGTREQAAGLHILDLINQARARPRYCGNQAFNAAPPVRWNDMLAESSLRHSEDMARYNFFDHVNPRDGTHSWERVERAGYKYSTTGENIGAGYQSAEAVVEGWIKSPGHCANLMNPEFTEMGAAMAVNRQSKMGLYWTQEFGTPL